MTVPECLAPAFEALACVARALLEWSRLAWARPALASKRPAEVAPAEVAPAWLEEVALLTTVTVAMAYAVSAAPVAAREDLVAAASPALLASTRMAPQLDSPGLSVAMSGLPVSSRSRVE